MYTKRTKRKKSPRELTKREKETLALLAEGYSTDEISQKLNVKICTVNSYKHIINTKLGTHNLALLTKYYLNSQKTETNYLESPTPICEIDLEQVPQIDLEQVPQIDLEQVPQIDLEQVPQIAPEQVPQIAPEQVAQIAPEQKEISEHVFKEGVSYQQHLDNYRHNLLSEGLRICNYNIRLLSKKLDLPERTIYRLLTRLGIKLNSLNT